MKVVVTGAAGFLGRHVASRFRDDGWEVIAFDLIEPVIAGVDARVGDFTDANSLEPVVAGADVIAHVGAIGDVYLAASQPSLAARVNVVGTSTVADVARKTGARVVYASTWEVYGEPEYQPIDEDHPTRPDHPYNITKLGGEAMLLAASRLGGVNAVALRLGTAYGAGLRANSVFRLFLDKARKREPLSIQGDGSQGRQFTHSSDIGRAFALAAASDISGVALNIVAPRMVTIKELAEHVIATYPTDVEFGPARAGDVPSATVSANRAKEALGWEAETTFEDGFEEFVASVPDDPV